MYFVPEGGSGISSEWYQLHCSWRMDIDKSRLCLQREDSWWFDTAPPPNLIHIVMVDGLLTIPASLVYDVVLCVVDSPGVDRAYSQQYYALSLLPGFCGTMNCTLVCIVHILDRTVLVVVFLPKHQSLYLELAAPGEAAAVWIHFLCSVSTLFRSSTCLIPSTTYPLVIPTLDSITLSMDTHRPL